MMRVNVFLFIALLMFSIGNLSGCAGDSSSGSSGSQGNPVVNPDLGFSEPSTPCYMQPTTSSSPLLSVKNNGSRSHDLYVDGKFWATIPGNGGSFAGYKNQSCTVNFTVGTHGYAFTGNGLIMSPQIFSSSGGIRLVFTDFEGFSCVAGCN